MATPPTSVTRYALELRRVRKQFAGANALDDVSFLVRAGTVHALLGENGAGKTTLMHVAYGIVRADAGTISVNGVQLRITSPAAAISAGIGMVHQHFTLVPAMTVAENIALGGHGRLAHARSAARADAISRRTSFALDPHARVDSLSVGAQQRVEIAKSLVHNATLLILDEPTAVLAPTEIHELLTWLRAYVEDGNAVVLITHKLHEALAIADDVTVLRRGRVTFTGRAADASVASLTRAMIGADTSSGGTTDQYVPRELGGPVFTATGMTLVDSAGRTRINSASFTVRGGEIVGVAGVEGAGQRELVRALAGRRQPSSGTLQRPDEVGFVPEDRHLDAVLLDRSLVVNIALRGAATRRGILDWRMIGQRTMMLMRVYDVRAPSPHAAMRSLSGGNQQKLVLARELTAPNDAARAIVVENPTRGLDVRAAANIHATLRAARDAGSAVVVYSSDLDEVLALASRMLVVYAGTVREHAADRDTVGRAMLGLI